MEQPKVFDALLQKATQFDISVAYPSILHKLGILKNKKSFSITPIYAGTLFEICNIMQSMPFIGIDDLKNDQSNKFLDIFIQNVAANTQSVNKILAYAIFNREINTIWHRLKFKRLIKFLNGNLTNPERLKLLNVVIQKMEVRDFLAFMVSIKGMNLIEAENAQTSGDLSEASLNTTKEE